MGELYKYSSGKFNVNYCGIDLTPGLVEGSSLAIRGASPDVSFRKNGLGGGIYVWNADRSGEVDLYIHPAHPIHQSLIALYEAIRAAKTLNGPLIVNDIWNSQNNIFTGALPSKIPDEGRGSELEPVVWTFLYQRRLAIPNLLKKNTASFVRGL